VLTETYVDCWQMRWAPGAGIKNSEFIDRWDVDVGVAFIPWEKLPSQLDSITEGSIVDEDSLPADFARGMLSCFVQLACSFTYRYCFISLMLSNIVWLIMVMMIVMVTLQCIQHAPLVLLSEGFCLFFMPGFALRA